METNMNLRIIRHIVTIGVMLILLTTINACSGGKEEAETDAPSTAASVAKAREHFNKGVQYTMKSRYTEAISEYKRSLEYDPDVAETHSNLGFAYLDSGDIEQAVTEQEKAIAIKPDYKNAYYGLALAYEKKGNDTEAINNWKEFLKLTEPQSTWWKKAKERLDILKKKRGQAT